MRVSLAEGDPFLRVEAASTGTTGAGCLRVENVPAHRRARSGVRRAARRVRRAARVPTRRSAGRSSRCRVSGSHSYAPLRRRRPGDAGLDTYGWSGRARRARDLPRVTRCCAARPGPTPSADEGEHRLSWAYLPAQERCDDRRARTRVAALCDRARRALVRPATTRRTGRRPASLPKTVTA